MKYLNNIAVLLSCIITLAAERSSAQEVLLPPGRYRSAEASTGQTNGRLKIDNIDTLRLPFFEDFSSPGTLPDQDLWTDRYVLINNSYTDDPVSIGVGTLDAVYTDGSLNGDSKTPFVSDYLTSKPINLDFPGRRDIWLSFYYQPQGLGDNPEVWDSLQLDFFDPLAREWLTVWSDTGRLAEDFRQVFIPVNQERFLKRGFQLRFKNYASLPVSQSFPSKNTNVDHWNIDYIYLDTARVNGITAVSDVSMTSSLESLLKSYEAIPWRHFKRAFQTQIKPFISVTYRNNDTTSRIVTRFLKITDRSAGKTEVYNGGAVNVAAGEKVSYDIAFNFPFFFYEKDSVLFEVKAYLVTDELDYKWNDTVTRKQEFYNYYAYDDGTAEAGYGLQGEGTINASVACRFESFQEDTIRGVQMYFNQVLNDVGSDYFKLTVWDHDQEADQPGRIIYSMLGTKPVFGSEINQYRIYEFDTTLTVGKIFYVGWIKTTTDMLNMGFDRNHVNNDRIYYNLGQEWKNSSFEGSLMMRPVLGPKIVYPAATPPMEEVILRLYPNPVSSFLRIETGMSLQDHGFTASVYNMQGALVLQEPQFNSGIDVSSLPEGIYLLTLKNNQGAYLTRRFVVQR